MSSYGSRHDDRGSRHEKFRGSEQEKSRIGDRERDRERDRNHNHWNDHRDRSKNDDRGRFRDSDRNRNNDRARDRGQRHISHSRSNDKSRNRSKSRSRSPSKSKRTSGFDMAPATPALPGAAFAGLVGMPQPVPGSIPTMFSLATPLATRHARRVYVGGLPPLANEQTIATFFSQVMSAVGGNSAGPGDAVVNVYINHEKKFAFVEMRTVEEASNAMALDGIVFEGVSVRVRRPTDYNPPLAAVLGPSQPNSHLNLAVVGLIPGATGGAEGPDRIFVGGLPYYFSDAQIRELLESFGPLRAFDLVKDRDSGNSKGYGFCVYQDPTATDVACASLNGLKMGDKTLTVRRATASTGQGKPEQEMVLQQAQHHIALQKLVLQAVGGLTLPGVETMPSTLTSSPPTKVVCLTEVVSENELREDGEYEEIIEDMREESGKFGSLVNVVIPRPSSNGEDIPGVGKVFLEYADTSASMRALAALHGRKFGGNVVTAVYYPEDRFFRGEYSEIITVD